LPVTEVDSTEPRFETPDGMRTYTEVADAIAERLSALIDDVQAGVYQGHPLDVDLIRHFHAYFLDGICPPIAGRWRDGPVQVGNHIPPEHWHLDRLMREFFSDLNARIGYVGDAVDLQIEALAFAEAKILNIHPFADFNGRAVRVLALEMVRRFDLPPVQSWVEPGGPESAEYKRALVAFDLEGSIEPLKNFWYAQRFG
jgi:fido (protein-threonine AMPylation protein)